MVAMRTASSDRASSIRRTPPVCVPRLRDGSPPGATNRRYVCRMSQIHVRDSGTMSSGFLKLEHGSKKIEHGGTITSSAESTELRSRTSFAFHRKTHRNYSACNDVLDCKAASVQGCEAQIENLTHFFQISNTHLAWVDYRSISSRLSVYRNCSFLQVGCAD